VPEPFWSLKPLRDHPGMQCLGERPPPRLVEATPLTFVQVFHLVLELVETGEVLDVQIKAPISAG
jgi:hypothetical protein